MIEESDSEEAITIMILGNSQVGKTSFILRFVENTFQSTYLSTVGIDFKVKNINLGDKEYKLILYDTAGQERYKSLAPNLIKNACGIILVYDITNKSSFDSIPEIMEKVKEEKGNNFPMVLVGNKIDLEQRSISYEEGKAFAEKNNLLFCECSSKNGKNIDMVFNLIIKDIINKKNFNDSKNISPTDSVKANCPKKLKRKNKVGCC